MTSQPIKAFIFDFDATLMDTEPNWFEADRQLMAEFGVDFTFKMKERYIGRSVDEMVNDLIKKHNIQISLGHFKEKKNGYYMDIARGNTNMFPRMKLLYEKLKRLGLPMAIATGSDYNLVDVFLTDLDLKKDFTLILGSESVERGKPAPDIYLKTASLLGVDPANCLVFEDSSHGVEAAKAAGMKCVAIPYLLNGVLPPVFQKAEILVEGGMNSLDPERVFNWISNKV